MIPVVGVLLEPTTWLWVALYAIVALSLNLEAGFAGVPNFGKALSVLVGAIVAATLPGFLGLLLLPPEEVERLKQLTGGDLNYAGAYNSLIADAISKYLRSEPLTCLALFVAVMVVAALAGAATGVLAAAPATRLRSDYLAIALLATAEAAMIVAYNTPQLGGTLGLTVPNILAWLEVYLEPFVGARAHLAAALVITCALAAAVFAYMELLARSPAGRLLKAVRDDEEAAEALGKNVARIRLKVLALGSALSAMAGALFVAYSLAFQAITFNRVSWTFWVWAMMILGGAANNVGVLLGTALLVLARHEITYNKELIAPYLPFDPVWLDQIMLGLILILVLMFRPQGLLPEKTVYPLPRKVIEKLRG